MPPIATANGDGTEKECATFTNLPQELIDKIIAPFLPNKIKVRVHKIHDSANKPAYIVEPTGAWKWAREMKLLHSKVGKTVREESKKIDTVELVIDDDVAGSKSFENDMDAEKWDEGLKKHDIQRVIVNFDYKHYEAPRDGKAVSLKIGKEESKLASEEDPKWAIKQIEWETDDPTNKSNRGSRVEIEGAISCVLGSWPAEGPTANMLYKLQLALILPIEELASMPWVRDSAILRGNRAASVRGSLGRLGRSGRVQRWTKETRKRDKPLDEKMRQHEKDLEEHVRRTKAAMAKYLPGNA